MFSNYGVKTISKHVRGRLSLRSNEFKSLGATRASQAVLLVRPISSSSQLNRYPSKCNRQFATLAKQASLQSIPHAHDFAAVQALEEFDMTHMTSILEEQKIWVDVAEASFKDQSTSTSKASNNMLPVPFF
jgi:hypothetical protein